METTRIVMGLFVAVLLPRGLPYPPRWRICRPGSATSCEDATCATG
jgi:hypothetical protein